MLKLERNIRLICRVSSFIRDNAQKELSFRSIRGNYRRRGGKDDFTIDLYI